MLKNQLDKKTINFIKVFKNLIKFIVFYLLTDLFVVHKVMVEPRNSFNSFKEVENTIVFVRRVYRIAI